MAAAEPNNVMTFSRIALCLAICCDYGLARGQSAWSSLSCISSLELPTRGLAAARASGSDTVVATVRVGTRDALPKIELVGGDLGLKTEVEVALRESKFSDRCTGKDIKLIFEFRLQDPPTENITPPVVRFLPPNRFLLIFRRVAPVVDLAPARRQ